MREQEIYIEKKMQELLINEGQLIQQRSELENKQKQLCTLLNSSPIEFDESQSCHLFFFSKKIFILDVTVSLVEINQKIQDHIKMLTDLKVCYGFFY